MKSQGILLVVRGKDVKDSNIYNHRCHCGYKLVAAKTSFFASIAAHYELNSEEVPDTGTT